MKKLLQLLGILLLLTSINTTAQNGINYKALIKDTSGNVIANTTIQVQFTIYEGAALSNNVYQETHEAASTDANGIIVLTIGTGNTTDVFTDINWGNDEHWLNVQVDTGSGFTDLGTTQFMAVPYALNAANVSYGLEKITESANGFDFYSGWRLKGVNPNYYGAIGENAIDLSNNLTASIISGATGNYAIATGFNTKASGDYATALGRNTIASEPYSTAMGNLTSALGETATAIGKVTEASGDTSTAMGNHTIASGDISTAIGFETDAIGDISLAAGHYTEASGDNSTSLGSNTRSKAFCTTAIGRYNVGFGNSEEWIESDALFEIGNGVSDGNRSNALTVYKNGSHYIESSAIGIAITAGTVGLSIFSSGESGIVALQSEKHGAVTEGKLSGLLTRSSIIGNPNIILAGNSSTNDGDNGIIISDPNYLSSDIFLSSNDDLVIKLDNNGNEDGVFRIRNDQDSDVFTVNESGDTNIDGLLTIGNETIEDGGTDVLAFSSSLVPTVDGDDRLGGPNRKWLDVYAINGIIQTSDRRSKTNIANLNYGLTEVLQMQPVSFNWKNKNNPDTKLGLIAQDVLKIVPEVVKTHIWEKDEVSGVLTKKEIDRLGVYYSDLVPVLIKAIQEQQEIIANQNTKIEGLTAQVTKLKSMSTRIKALEALLITKSEDVKVVSSRQ